MAALLKEAFYGRHPGSGVSLYICSLWMCLIDSLNVKVKYILLQEVKQKYKLLSFYFSLLDE